MARYANNFIAANSTPIDWYVPARPPSCTGSFGFAIRLCPARKGKKFCLRIRIHKVGDQSFQCHKEVVDNKWQGECAICSYYNERYKEGVGDIVGLRPAKPRFYKGSEEDFTQ